MEIKKRGRNHTSGASIGPQRMQSSEGTCCSPAPRGDSRDGRRRASSITPKKGAELYAGLRRRKTKSGKQLSVDSHRNILAEAKSFPKWCAE
jgi:hypothetical protein